MSDERFGVIGEVDEKQLRLLVRDWRRGRADRNLFQAMQDAYVMVFALVLIGAMVISSIMQAQRSVAGCMADSCLAARGLLPWAAVAGFLALALVAARLFGPVVASAAEGFWVMDGNVDRRRMLAGRLIASVIMALVLGAGLGVLVAALVGGDTIEVLTWGLASGLGCFGLVAFAAAEQGAERRWITTALLWLIGIIAFAALLVLVAISAGMASIGLVAALSVDFAWVVAGGGLLLGLISIVPAWLRLRHMRRQRLTAGSSLLAACRAPPSPSISPWSATSWSRTRHDVVGTSVRPAGRAAAPGPSSCATCSGCGVLPSRWRSGWPPLLFPTPSTHSASRC